MVVTGWTARTFWTATGVVNERLVSGIDVKSLSLKLKAPTPTGISEDIVSSNGLVEAASCAPKNSRRNRETCIRGCKGIITFETVVPFASVRTRLTLPAPNDGFASAMEVEFCATG